MDRADGQEQKQIKRASNKMRFDRGADVRVHVVSASVRKHLLLEARQGCRDFSPLDSNETKMSDGGRDRALCAVKSRPNIFRPLGRFSLFRDVLPKRVGQIERDVVSGFGSESIEKGPVFITDPAPRESPDGAIGRVAEQASQGGTVGCPALGIQHAQMKLEETVFVAPEHRGQVTVQDEAILIGQSFAVGGA